VWYLIHAQSLAQSGIYLQIWANGKIKQWDKANSDLQKTVNKYSANCSIISDIRDIRNRKSNLDDLVQRGYSQYQSASYDFQVQILSLQQRLTCEQ
jgi:hypothetical protein